MSDRQEPTWDPARLASLGGAMLDAVSGAHMGLSLTFLDGPSPRVAFINDEGARILGWSRERLLNTSPIEVITPAERPQAMARAERRHQGDDPGRWFAMNAHTEDGRQVPIEVGMSHLTIDGRPAVVSFFLDVTARRDALEALARSEERFRKLIE